MQSTMESIAGFLRWGGVQAKGVTEGFLKKIVEASGRLGESQPPLKNPINTASRWVTSGHLHLGELVSNGQEMDRSDVLQLPQARVGRSLNE